MPSTCPPPVYIVDAPFSELGTAELLLTTTLRLFAQTTCGHAGIRPDWRSGFVAARIADEGVPAFESLFGIVATASLRPLQLWCAQCRILSCDEARLLQMVSLIQSGRPNDAGAILATWLPPAAVRLAILPAMGLARAMARRGLIVPMRHIEAITLRRILPAYADRGLVLVQ